MNYKKIIHCFILGCLSILYSTGAMAQPPLDCMPGVPPVDGIWKDNGNGKEVEITVTPYINGGSHAMGKIVAAYTDSNKVCKNPDKDGNPVPFKIDFDGLYDKGFIGGSLYYCAYHTPGSGSSGDPKNNTPYTLGIWVAVLKLTESEDGMSLNGTFEGKNGVDSISFTRISKLEPSPSYTFSYKDVANAIVKAFQEHGISGDPIFQSNPAISLNTTKSSSGWGFAIPVVRDPKDPMNSAPIIIIGSVEALPPCKTLKVTLNIWELRKGEDGKLYPHHQTAGTDAQDEFSQKGLDDAMRAAFDKLDVRKNMPPRPPS